MKTLRLEKMTELLAQGFLSLCLFWVFAALSFQLFFIYLHTSGQEQRERDLINKIEWKVDGRFKNNPDNIWYEAPKK